MKRAKLVIAALVQWQAFLRKNSIFWIKREGIYRVVFYVHLCSWEIVVAAGLLTDSSSLSFCKFSPVDVVAAIEMKPIGTFRDSQSSSEINEHFWTVKSSQSKKQALKHKLVSKIWRLADNVLLMGQNMPDYDSSSTLSQICQKYLFCQNYAKKMPKQSVKAYDWHLNSQPWLVEGKIVQLC